MPPGSRQIEMTWRCSACEHQNRGRHKTCQNCGDPKDKAERYEMPADTVSAPSVVDTSLLKFAEAGPNWTCSYCGSHQRKGDGTCGQCGASASEAEPELRALVMAWTPWQRAMAWVRKHRIKLAIAGGLLALILGIYLWVNRTREFTAKVADATWNHTIAVSRYQIWAREGWRNEQPGGAFDVVSQGQRIHHYDSVLDGYDTVHYTEQVRCGETCRDVPQTCRERCSDNGNGFASCTTSCSGGGRSCSPKYCSESRTKQVARYRQEPRYAESIAYNIWDWGYKRSAEATGKGASGVRWPVDEARTGQGLAPREQEREARTTRYTVTLAYDESDKLVFEVPTLEELAKFSIGSKHTLRIKRNEPTLVDGKPVAPTQ